MAIREFTDDQGVVWRVWTTVPSNRKSVAAAFRDGWLCFDNGADRRRFGRIPRDWEQLTDERLLLVLRMSAPSRKTPPAGMPRSNDCGDEGRPSSGDPVPAWSVSSCDVRHTPPSSPPPRTSPHMAHRAFQDSDGRRWEVWDVHPASVEPRRAGRIHLPVELREGWLAFQTGGESRRLAPIPATWPSMSDDDLTATLARAPQIPRHRGR